MALTKTVRALTISRDTARLLSQSTYHELVLALREIVSNASDAQSATAEISLQLTGRDRKGGKISVLDRGEGMDAESFERIFLRLGRSSRANAAISRLNKFGRQTIGMFGIGFIAAVPFAELIRVETASERCEHVHGVEIKCEEIMESSESVDSVNLTLQNTGEEEASLTPDDAEPTSEFKFPGWDRDRTEADTRSFTSVTLENLTRLAYDSIDAQLTGSWYQPKRERKKPITRAMRENFVSVWLSRVLPLGYTNPNGDHELQQTLREFLPKNYHPVSVSVNGKRIYRPLAEAVLRGKPFVLKGHGGEWRARGLLWSPQEVISPYYLRGIPIRISDVAVGQPSYFNLNEMGRVYGKLQHIAGEVHLEGFSGLLTLDRQSLKGSVESDEFYPLIRQKITEFESELQEKASVMEEVRDLKRAIDAQYPEPMGVPTLAPVLLAGDRAKELVARARKAGIKVEVTDEDAIEVPRGERSFTIGRFLGQDLLRIGRGKRQISVVINPSKAVLTDVDLVSAILSSGPTLTIRGSHVLLSNDAWALGNLRILALLRLAVEEGKLDKTQVQWLVEELRGLYE